MIAVTDAVFEVFEEISGWIVSQLQSLVALFWTASEGGGGELTFLGTIALISLGISVIFLMLRVVQNFLHFRG